ncbi:DUF302 domain-containing protein [Rhodoblastus sp.]|uniref:DUF302 domain-containing protein n=1 Tax=Rhodoblastus sp. TaxID=1962975 RepID=UPI0035B2A640
MAFIRNALALVGLLALAGGLALFIKARAVLADLDPGAGETYAAMTKILIQTGNPAEATVWKAQVKQGLSFDDVDQAIRSLAAGMNLKDVGALPLGDQVGAMQGKPWRRLKIYLYCNPLTAAHMIDYSEAFAAYLPCRIALLEDGSGRLWIYTLNMDLLIHGGKTLPPELKAEALQVRAIMRKVLEEGAEGAF